MDHPFVFHLVQASLWDETVAADSTYYPPTYDIDGFTHGTANPQKLLAVANRGLTRMWRVAGTVSG